VNTPDDIKEESKKVLKRLHEIENDPEFIKESIDFARKLHYISPEALLRPFTI